MLVGTKPVKNLLVKQKQIKKRKNKKMYNYPMRIHYHRKNGEYDTCSFVKSQDQRIDLLTYKRRLFWRLYLVLNTQVLMP